MSRSSTLTELIDATPCIDVHEHLVEERHRLRDGASEFVEVFGDSGRHARSAVGVAELPLGAPVEVEAILEVR